MDSKKIIIKADIKRIITKKRKVVLISFLVLAVVSLVVGIATASMWSIGIPNREISWFGVNFYNEAPYDVESYYRGYFDGRYRVYFEYFNIIIVALLYTILIAGPFIIHIIYNKMCKNTELTVTEEEILGSYSSFISKKTLQIPIEKVDNMTIISTFKDKLKTGKTLGICTASGIIKLHFIHNAEEIVSVTMNKINEVKNKESINCSTETKTVYATSDKLKEILHMKDTGLISNEEYEKMREEILCKIQK